MKFVKSFYFNAVLAVIAAVLIIMQEVWLGTPPAFINGLTIGGAASIGFSIIAEVVKFFCGEKFNKTHALIGAVVGIVAALVVMLLI